MYTPKGYLGFESRSLRKTFIIKESASQKRCWFRFGGQAVESLLSRGLLPQNGIAALRAAQLLDAPQFCRAPAASGKGACKGAKRLRKSFFEATIIRIGRGIVAARLAAGGPFYLPARWHCSDSRFQAQNWQSLQLCASFRGLSCSDS